MAFDAGMLACVIAQIREKSLGARVEKVFQPMHDEILLQLRSIDGGRRLLINAGSSTPRLCFSSLPIENPPAPPMLCMLLRKHLQGARLADVRQFGFERVAELVFETRDEMGFPCRRSLIAEIMGKYSNLIFVDEHKRVLAATRTVDFSTSSLRQVLPGMTYELPPAQDKQDPLATDRKHFLNTLAQGSCDRPADKWLCATYLGISAAVAREISFLASGSTDTPLRHLSPSALADAFFSVVERIRTANFTPSIVFEDNRPVEYAFLPLTHYGQSFSLRTYEGADEMLDAFFSTRDRIDHIRQRASDLLHILTRADSRIRKKLDLQRGELADCDRGEEYRRYADLITANMHLLARGMTEAELIDYEDYREDGSFGKCRIPLNGRLSPSANAQFYYKRYNKSKTARRELTRQIALGEEELRYIDSIFDSLSHAETAADLAEIREELFRSGYASRMKNYTSTKKQPIPTVARFRTGGGFLVLCGKNNVQNEYITHKLADKNDYWFHVKNLPGSHTVLVCHGEEPSERDFTEAAEIAAFFSKGAGAQNVEVDYTLVRHVKKPAGSKPGFVIYHTNWSCVVTPEEGRVQALREK